MARTVRRGCNEPGEKAMVRALMHGLHWYILQKRIAERSVDDERLGPHRRRPVGRRAGCRHSAACVQRKISKILHCQQETEAIEGPPSTNPQKRKCAQC